MSSAEPKARIMAPHAVAFDGYRWHVRAFCHTRGEFRDFVLARMLGVEVLEEAGTEGADDEAWHRQVSLVLAANTRLSVAHRKVIELDYGMVGGEVVLECRQALLFYSLKRLGLLEVDASEPHVQQIVLRNRSAVMKFLPPASTAEGRR